jgi:copper chaperone
MSTYTVHGMTCGSCSAKVTGAVNQIPGVTGTDVDLATGTLTVEGPDADADAVRTAIVDAGYQVG